MTPKKAIMIVLILFFIIMIAFVILYASKQPAIAPSDGLNADQAGQTGVIGNEPPKPAEVIENKVNQIIEDAKNDPAASPDTVRQEIISTINADIIKQQENKTPEQKAADLKAQEERQKIIDEINNKIKQAN